MKSPTPLSKQVVSLELAKKLKALDCKQESLFWWIRPNHDGKHKPYILIYKDSLCEDESCGHKPISAFTTSELGRLLPWVIETNKNIDDDLQLEIQREGNNGIFMVAYHCYKGTNNCVQCLYKQNDLKLSDALAKMLIYLLKNKLI